MVTTAHPFQHDRSHSSTLNCWCPISAIDRHRGHRIARGLGLNVLLLLLLWPWAIGLAQDLPTAPVNVAASSADSVGVSVDLSDLSDSAKFPLSSTGKWTGYLEFLGKPGTERSLGQPDLFLPLLQDVNDMTFFNLRGQLQFDNTDVHEYNIGLGHRHMFQEWILGGYGYFDHRNTPFNNVYNQFTGGLEALSVDWDFRVNGYLPENKTETITRNANVGVIQPGDQINVKIDGIVQEKALPGLDGEVGYLLPIPWKAYTAVFDETRVYAGGYHFLGEGQFESVTGTRGRVEWRAYDLPALGPGSRFMMGVEAQWDEPRGSQAFGLASLRIPFDVFSDKSTRKALTGLDRRMLQPVIRDVDIVTSEVEVPAEITAALNQAGQAYTKVVEVDFTNEADLQTVLDDPTNQEAPTLIIPKNNGGMISLSDTLALNTNQTLGGAGLNVDYESATLGFGTIGHSLDGAVEGFLASAGFGGDRLIDMAPDTGLNGVTLNANENSPNALRVNTDGGDTAGTRYVANSHLKDSTGDVLLAQGSGAVIRIDHSRFTGSSGSSANGSGVEAKDEGTIYISNSYIGDNGGHGLHADGDGTGTTTIIADNMTIANNGNSGVDANGGGGGGAFVKLTNSLVTGGFRPIVVNGIGNKIFMDNVDVINNDDGVNVWDGELEIYNTRIFGSDLDGLYIQGSTASVIGDKVTIIGVGKGTGIDFRGGTVTLTNTTASEHRRNYRTIGSGGSLTLNGCVVSLGGTKVYDHFDDIPCE